MQATALLTAHDCNVPSTCLFFLTSSSTHHNCVMIINKQRVHFDLLTCKNMQCMQPRFLNVEGISYPAEKNLHCGRMCYLPFLHHRSWHIKRQHVLRPVESIIIIVDFFDRSIYLIFSIITAMRSPQLAALSVIDAQGRHISLLNDIPEPIHHHHHATIHVGKRRYHCNNPGCNKSFTTR